MTDKAAVRREARARLRGLGPDARTRAGKIIASCVWEIEAVSAARSILLYASLPEEVPTDDIAREARSRGIQVVYPRCLEGPREMSLHTVQAESDLLADGRWGIREPAVHCPIARPEEIDVAFLPGLAWDRTGNRLGRGAGYYDQLLADPGLHALRCGLFFAAQEFPVIPADEWDAPLDMVVTEEGAHRLPQLPGSADANAPSDV